MAESESSKRQVAYKVKVADILNNRYVKEEGWLPNFIAVGDKKVSRANLLGVIVSKSSQDADSSTTSFILDDGSGRVALRFFESTVRLDVGDIVFVIGRPREFGADRYIVPEIIRKVSDARWVEVRKLELVKEKQSEVKVQPQAKVDDVSMEVETEEFVADSSPLVKVVSAMRKLDSGDGVSFEELAERFGESTDGHVKRLLEQGDIFEIKPGRFKVLE